MFTVLVLFAVAGDDSASRKQSAVAPSLKALSKEEEADIDDIISRFVRADTGKLKGAEARKAIDDFEKLPPEAIPALVRALNRAANENQSCPVLTITKKLTRMLMASDDDKLLEFARDELGADDALSSRYGGNLKDLRYKITARRNALASSSKPTKTPSPKPGLEKASTAELVKAAGSERGEKLLGVVAELGKRDGKEALAALGVVAGSEGDARKPARMAIDTSLGRLGVVDVSAYLEDENAELRKGAVRVAAKNPRLLGKVIDRVEDEDAGVRAEARAELKAASKGQDFGPGPDASTSERFEAKKKWQAWLERK